MFVGAWKVPQFFKHIDAFPNKSLSFKLVDEE